MRHPVELTVSTIRIQFCTVRWVTEMTVSALAGSTAHHHLQEEFLTDDFSIQILPSLRNIQTQFEIVRYVRDTSISSKGPIIQYGKTSGIQQYV